MAEEDKSLSKAIADFLKAAEDRKSDPKWKATIDAVNALRQSEAGKGSFADLLTSSFIDQSVKAQQQKRAAETGIVDGDTANSWFAKYWPTERRACPVCGTNDWGLNPQFVHMSLGPMGAILRTRTVPCVSLTCRNCSYTLLFNAIMMGQLPRGEE